MKNSIGQQLMQEEGADSQLSDQEAKAQAIANIRKQYGLSEQIPQISTTDDAASYLAKSLASKRPADLQAQDEANRLAMGEPSLEEKLRAAGETGMQGGMAMGSIANVGRFSNVARNLANELGAAKKASNLMQLGAKAAPEAMKTGTKMSPEQLKALAQAMIKKGM